MKGNINLELKIPEMVSVREAARRTGMSYAFIRKLCQEEQIVYVQAGSRCLVNFSFLVDYLQHGRGWITHDCQSDQEG